MRMTLLRTILTASVLAAAATLASAHHSGAMFDRGKTATITGTVTEFNWTNPHSSIKVEVTANGKAESWAIEMNSPNNLVREGWKRTTIKPGDKVTLTINPLRDGKPGGWYLSIKLPDGKQLGTTAAPAGDYPASPPQ
jgi:uncharacterized cupredoxin-like copper-binding protein